MAQRRRGSQFRMNFDGLTDAVTNLVGALVLLVVLLIGITERASYRPPTVAAGAAAEGDQTDETQLEDLFRRTEILREQVAQANRRIDRYEAELATIRERVADITASPANAEDESQ